MIVTRKRNVLLFIWMPSDCDEFDMAATMVFFTDHGFDLPCQIPMAVGKKIESSTATCVKPGSRRAGLGTMSLRRYEPAGKILCIGTSVEVFASWHTAGRSANYCPQPTIFDLEASRSGGTSYTRNAQLSIAETRQVQ